MNFWALMFLIIGAMSYIGLVAFFANQIEDLNQAVLELDDRIKAIETNHLLKE